MNKLKNIILRFFPLLLGLSFWMRDSLAMEKITALGWHTQRSSKDEISALAEWFKANEYRYSSFCSYVYLLVQPG